VHVCNPSAEEAKARLGYIARPRERHRETKRQRGGKGREREGGEERRREERRKEKRKQKTLPS
jgi:hypothetical protein